MTKDEALRLALEALENITSVSICEATHHAKKDRHLLCEECPNEVRHLKAITAIKAALEAKDEPVGLIESLKEAKPCCGQYATCWRACTPRGKFIGHRDAQRKPLTDEEIERLWPMRPTDDVINFARAIEAAHGIKGEA